ncbi:hypothetical protein U5801_21405 [Lamprobacter modestohalophilus]|uniref:hypothetical protein n=1 Tax=Lamprobacter modestohalophilus TaxID=1064514 RepID=UPI002ADEFBF1|nr:hypothetical protein [Lamprobacter modestohalophilus]MEA1052342.1 hypothetical protein [Lamprobacter modestohalophilus]
MSEYATLNRMLKAYREHVMSGDLCGCDTHDAFVAMIRSIEARMFQSVANA